MSQTLFGPGLNPLRDPRDKRLPRIAGPCSMVMFGVTGDLARKKLMPAIYDLSNRGLLPPGFALVGFARRDWEDQDFGNVVHDSVRTHARTPFQEEVWRQLAEGLRFVPGTFDDPKAFEQLATTLRGLDEERGTGGNHAFYLSIPPGNFAGVCEQLQRSGLTEQHGDSWRRVVIEKPFGHDLASARALNDIVEVTVRADGSEIRRYIQDRTVIEDTESSIDLAIHGWGLHNYPERLSYSATPPDFGSLVIQRRRWSNGGLLILPKMWRHWRERRRRGEHTRFGEVALRVNYMASTCWASIGLVLLLAYPFQDKLLSPFAVLAALPYFLAMAGDLRRSGYKRSDIFRIYAFNLVLLPVNLAGVLKSVQQMVTGRKIPFARTPKVRNRTASPVLFALVPWLLVAFCGYSAVRDFNAAHWGNFAFDCFNGALTLYGIVAYMGIWNSVHDIVAGLIDRLYVVEPGRPVDHSLRIQGPTWREVLDQGTSRSSGVALGEDVQDPGTRRLPVG